MSKVKTSREKMAIPTYPRGDANPNPILAAYRGEKPYPYKMYDALGDEAVEETYEALVLENEYLRVIVLPELGGKLYAALDKRNGESLFYLNRVVKPQLIGLTGAWTAGGIEFNFPRAHRPSSMERLDAALRDNSDGSASAIIGETDRSSGLRFTVELRLYPGKAYIEQIVRIHNPEPYPQRCYFWNTSSYPETEQLEGRYPAKWGIEEFSRRRAPWPLLGDVDARRFADIPGLAAMFTSGSDEDFFGVYDARLDRGTVHVSGHREMPGKKLWAWGHADLGRLWCRVLTDEDGPYMEYQAGNVQTQADFTFLQPFQQHTWKEYWFQAFHTGPFTYACKEAVIGASLAADEGACRLAIRMLVNETFADAELCVLHDDAVLFREARKRTPDQAEHYSVPLPEDGLRRGALRLRLYERGELLFEYEIMRSRALSDELDEPPDEQRQDSPDALPAQLRRAEARDNYGKALAIVEQMLAHHPLYPEALVRKAVLQIKTLRYEAAAATLDEALKPLPMSDELLYYAGLAEWLCGRPGKARPLLLEVNDLSVHSAAASMLLGRIALRERRWWQALGYYRHALGRDASEARVCAAIAARGLGDRTRAGRLLGEALAADPLDPYALAEWRLLTGEDKAGTMLSDNRDMLLKVAERYREIGDAQAEKALLADYGADDDPLVLYHIGYSRSREGLAEEAAALYRRAEALPPDYVFPVLAGTLEALGDAERLLGDEAASLYYYMGLIHYRHERFEEAERSWLKAAAGNWPHSVLYRNLGRLMTGAGDEERAIALLEQGLHFPPANSELISSLDLLYRKKGMNGKRRPLLGGRSAQSMDNTLIRVLLLIELDEGRFDQAIELFDTYPFRAWEVEDNPAHNLKEMYHRACLGRARQAMDRDDWTDAAAYVERSMRYPANTQLARTAEQTFVEALYCRAICEEKLGRYDLALSSLRQAVDEGKSGLPGREGRFFLKALGKKLELEWLGWRGSSL